MTEGLLNSNAIHQHNTMTKRQHTVPQVYLKSFCDTKSNKLQYLDIVAAMKYNKFLFKESGTRGVCWGECIYELKLPDGSILFPNWIENYLSTIESEFPRHKFLLLQSVEQGLKSQSVNLTQEERLFWLKFITVQMVRSPDFINLATMIISSQLSISQEPSLRLTTLALLFPVEDTYKGQTIFEQVYKTLLRLDFRFHFVVNSTTAHFFTSEFPILTSFEADLMKDLCCFIPITPALGLCFISSGAAWAPACDSVILCSPEQVEALNYGIISCANQSLICDRFSNNDKEYIKSVFNKAKRERYISRFVSIISLLINKANTKAQSTRLLQH